MWGELAKGIGKAVAGGAKKVAADKLLNRKKKPPQAGVEQEKGGALAIRPTTALVPKGPSGIVSSPGGALTTTDSGGAGGGKGNTPTEIALNISTKIVRVENLLKGSVAIKKKIRSDARKSAEIDENKEQEKALEKIKKPKGSGKFKVPIPGKSLLSKVFGFFTTMMFGWLAVRLVDWMPKLVKILKPLAIAADWVVDKAVLAIDFLAGVIDFGYKLVDGMESWVKDTFGEEGAEKFRTFMGNLKDLVSAFLVWKLIGEKIFNSIINSIRTVWRTVTRAIRTIWVKLRRLVGRHVRRFFGQLMQRAGGVLRQAGTGILNVGRNLASRAGGLLSQGGSRLASTGAGKVASKVGGWAAKIFGKAANVVAPALKAATPAVKGFAKRIPIMGPLIVALVSLMSGEPVGQALFKGIGAAIGGALGTFIPIPFVGTLLGEAIGTFVGDLLFYLIIKRDPKKAFEVLKQTLMGIFKAGEFVFNFIKDGLSRVIENFPTVAIPDFRPGDIIAKMMMNFPGGLDILGLEVPKWVPFVGGSSVIGFLQGIPGLQEVMGFFARFIPGMGKFIKNGRLLAIPNLLMLTPFGLPFLAPLVAKSFLPGLLGDPTPPEAIGEAPQAPEKISAESIRAEADKRRKEARDKMFAAAGKKLGEAKEFAGNVLQKANPMNWLGGGKDKKEESPSMLTGGMLAKGGSVNLHKGEIVIDPDSAGPAKDMLLAINQANSYAGIVEAIRAFAPYEALASEAITLPSPGGGSGKVESKKVEGDPKFVPIGAGGGSDPFEALDFFG